MTPEEVGMELDISDDFSTPFRPNTRKRAWHDD